MIQTKAEEDKIDTEMHFVKGGIKAKLAWKIRGADAWFVK